MKHNYEIRIKAETAFDVPNNQFETEAELTSEEFLELSQILLDKIKSLTTKV